MHLKTTLYLFPFLLFSCLQKQQRIPTNPIRQPQVVHPQKPQGEVVEAMMPFATYSARIAMLELPIGGTCGEDQIGNAYDFLQDEVKNYTREENWIWGKLAETKRFTAIIYVCPADDILPIIQTTDKQGNKISELQFYTNYCGEDEAYWGTARARVEADLTITLTDSSERFQRDVDNEIIPETVKTTVRHRYFIIREDGKIIEKK